LLHAQGSRAAEEAAGISRRTEGRLLDDADYLRWCAKIYWQRDRSDHTGARIKVKNRGASGVQSGD
jgi:hypothetical protein